MFFCQKPLRPMGEGMLTRWPGMWSEARSLGPQRDCFWVLLLPGRVAPSTSQPLCLCEQPLLITLF